MGQRDITDECCGLHKYGNPVPGDYRTPNFDILVVLRNPGRQEAAKGIPAIGPTGSMLRRYLHEAGLLSRCAFSNVVHCYTPGNRKPTESELRACLPLLKEELEPHVDRIKLVLCVGFEAAKWAGGFKGAIGSNVGQLRRKSAIVDAPAYAMYHPSYLYHTRGDPKFRELERQYRNQLQEAKHIVEVGTETPVYEWHPAEAIRCAGEYAIDTEYSGDARTASLIMAQVHLPDGRTFLTQKVEALAGTPVMHFAQGDLIQMYRHSSVDIEYVDDTGVLAWLRGETELGLKRLAQKYLEANVMGYAEAQSLGGWSTWFDTYMPQDPVLTWRLKKEEFDPWLATEPKLKAVYENIDRPLQPILAQMSITGIPIDQTEVRVQLAAARSLQNKLLAIGQHQAGWDINLGSNEQVAKWLYEDLGLPHPRKKPDAKHPSVDRIHLNKLNTHETRLVLKYRQVQKLAGTYLEPLSMSDFISGLWKIFGTETGRLSCEARNLQNLPDVINALLRAPEGMVPIHADYKGFELRIGAYESRDPVMIEYLSDPNADMHRDCCMEVYGRYTKRLKTNAKSAIFERMYGGGVDMAASILNIPRREAALLFAWQDKHLAGFLTWAERQIEKCLAQGYVESIFGRRRILHDLDSTDERIVHKAAKEAVNTPIQGPGGDCCYTGDMRVLTPDLVWKRIEDVEIGEKLLSFDENAPRHWRVATVLMKNERWTEVWKVTLADGTVLKMTPDHPMLTHSTGHRGWIPPTRYNMSATRRTKLSRILPVWETDNSQAAGWLSGFMDGEGTLALDRRLLEATQVVGPTYEKLKHLLTEKGFAFSETIRPAADRRQEAGRVRLLGGTPEVLRFLGQIRPQRLLDKFVPMPTALSTHPVRVESVRKLGSRKVINFATDTQTYIVEGFATHNTKRAMVLLWEPLRQMGGMIGRNVHDSIDMWVPPERVNDGAELLKTAMLTAVPQAIKDVVPIYVDLEVGGFGAA